MTIAQYLVTTAANDRVVGATTRIKIGYCGFLPVTDNRLENATRDRIFPTTVVHNKSIRIGSDVAVLRFDPKTYSTAVPRTARDGGACDVDQSCRYCSCASMIVVVVVDPHRHYHHSRPRRRRAPRQSHSNHQPHNVLLVVRAAAVGALSLLDPACCWLAWFLWTVPIHKQ